MQVYVSLHMCTFSCVSVCLIACSGGFTVPINETTFELLSSDKENAIKTKRRKGSTVHRQLFAMVIRQANLPLFACYCCLLVCLYFSHKMAVYHLDSFAPDEEHSAPGHHQVSLFGL